jgi:Matrixin
MKLKFSFVVFFIGSILFAQHRYYKLGNANDLNYTYNRSEALRWFTYFNIKTSEDFNWVPSYLSNVQSRFNDAVTNWQNAVNQGEWYLTIFQNQVDGIKVFFADTTIYFDAPDTEFAVATQCVANNEFVDSCTEEEAQLDDPVLPNHPPVTRARIAFNGTTDLGPRFSTETCDNIPSDKYSFTYVAMHEMGHMLGLPHADITPSSVMYPEMRIGPDVCYINSDDISWAQNLLSENPISLLERSPFKSRQHYFYDYDPAVFLYLINESKLEKPKDKDADGSNKSKNNSHSDRYGCSKEKLFTKPENNNLSVRGKQVKK